MAFALEHMVTLMVTACPIALGVAIPLVVTISTALSARGDNERIASAIAGKLGMNGYLANVLPHEKQQKIQSVSG